MNNSKCIMDCRQNKSPCQNDVCRHWIDYNSDLNCSIVASEDNGPMNLQEIAERLGLSIMHVKNIQDAAMSKLKKRILPILNE